MTRLDLSALSLMCVLGTSGVLAQTVAVAQAVPGHSMVSAADLNRADLPSLPPGAKIAVMEGPMNEAVPFTARLRLPAHWHPAIEHVSVLSGTLYMGVGEALDVSKGMAVPTGGFAVMQTKTPHFAYTAKADDPRKKQP